MLIFISNCNSNELLKSSIEHNTALKSEVNEG